MLEKINQQWCKKNRTDIIPGKKIQSQTWQQVFLQLDLQEYLEFFDLNPDFTHFYEKLNVAAPYLTQIQLNLKEIKFIKSGYFFLTQTLSKLKNLNQIIFYRNKEESTVVKAKCLKAIAKGLNNLISSGSKINSLAYYNLYPQGNAAEIVDNIFSPMYKIDSLTHLTISNCSILH